MPRVAVVMIAIIFNQFGPYHHARVTALQAASSETVVPAQMAAETTTYEWTDAIPVESDGLVTLCQGQGESLAPWRVFFASRRFFKKYQIQTALLPSYAPGASLAVLLAAMSCGVRRVMMNESHAGTERAKGWKRQIKQWLVGRFHAALVGGTPQKRHFTALGMDPNKIFTGYDAIDNEFFAREADRARGDSVRVRERLGLPPQYILSLGRIVEKKNLACLVEAYSELRKRLGEETPALVFVGSGEQESSLRIQCNKLNLQVVDSRQGERQKGDFPRLFGCVWMLGFRQIDENPAFYALADYFVLPSLWEEWGLVVNEAMACGLPVIVSQTVGSAEDLVRHGVNGFQFDPSSPRNLSEFMEDLSSSQELRKRMGQSSREIIADWSCKRFAEGALAAVAAAGGTVDDPSKTRPKLRID